MKRAILFSAAVLALAMLSSCRKQQTPSQTEGVTEFTATIDKTEKRDTKTSITIEGNVGKIEWLQGDEITVTDRAGAKAIYVALFPGPWTLFQIKAGETPLGAGPYTAAYGDIAKQTYSAVGANCPLFVTSATTEFQFKCELAILKITASSSVAKTVKSVKVDGGGTSVTLDCGAGVALSSGAKDFYIAINPGAYTQLKVTFTATDNTAAEMSRTSGIELKANDLLPVDNFILKNWKALPPEGALPGKFSVSATKKVYFSKGNLTYNVLTKTWAFYEHQYDCASGYDANFINIFTWGYSSTKSIIPDGSAPDNVSRTSGDLTQSEDWGCTIGDGNTWRTLSNGEWKYLFGNSAERSGKYKCGVTVCGKTNCMVIAPDDWNISTNPLQGSYDSSTWPAAEAAGLVCLPAAGGRWMFYIYDVDSIGYYWSSSACDEYDAYAVSFISTHFDHYSGTRDRGCSVRLVTEVK